MRELLDALEKDIAAIETSLQALRHELRRAAIGVTVLRARFAKHRVDVRIKAIGMRQRARRHHEIRASCQALVTAFEKCDHARRVQKIRLLPRPLAKCKDDLSGREFDRWTAIAPFTRNWTEYWECRCRCGTTRLIPKQSLIDRVTKSCGCLRRDLARAKPLRPTGETFTALRHERATGRFRCPCGFDSNYGRAIHAHKAACSRAPTVPPSKDRKRPCQPRPVTIDVSRVTKRELELGRLAYPETDYSKPATRGDCSGSHRPCPYVSCKHHLYLDVSSSTGSIKLNFPNLEPAEMKESCALDVADRGGATLRETAAYLNVTFEAVRLIQKSALLRNREDFTDDAP